MAAALGTTTVTDCAGGAVTEGSPGAPDSAASPDATTSLTQGLGINTLPLVAVIAVAVVGVVVWKRVKNR